MSDLPSPSDLPGLFRTYEWDSMHAAYGWPADRWDTGFPWMESLLSRFAAELHAGRIPRRELFVEVILWGGNQRNILGNFARSLRIGDDYEAWMARVVDNLESPERAITCALGFRGIGLTYGSKLLLFLCPERYGALDGRIRTALGAGLPPARDGDTRSCCRAYVAFVDLLQHYTRNAAAEFVTRPAYGHHPADVHWTAAEVEAALFAWASSPEPRV